MPHILTFPVCDEAGLFIDNGVNTTDYLCVTAQGVENQIGRETTNPLC